MARIRSVKPELRRDLTVAEWPRECRYAWVLLWGYLDDHGRGLDDLRLLVADLFPLDRDVTERKLDGWLTRMSTQSIHGEAPLCRYEVGGRRFLHAPKWSRSQRVSHPQDSKIPPCPRHDSGTVPESLPNENRAAPERFATSRTPAEQGSKGAGSKGPDAVPAAGRDLAFEEFWLIYPRKEGKGHARKAWDKAVHKAAPDEIISAAVRLARQPGREDKFTPHPST